MELFSIDLLNGQLPTLRVLTPLKSDTMNRFSFLFSLPKYSFGIGIFVKIITWTSL
jgi:hypothetical protein